MAVTRVQTEDFDVGDALAELLGDRTDIGGVGCFIGRVREQSGGRRLVAMTLEHYPAMTNAALAGIAAEAERRWRLLGCTVVHRIGRLLPGENIVLVLADSTHRQPALDATAFLIDWLKTKAPFWKKEEFADGSEAWVEARAEDEAAAARWIAE
jgi:molybdopterin synthase catalytic subunit